MNFLKYWSARLVVALLQALPLQVVALFGRAGGAVAWLIDRKHRTLVLQNLQASFKDKTHEELHALGRETFRRIGENSAAAIKTASFDLDQVLRVTDIVGIEKFPDFTAPAAPKNCVIAIGHFGNFELLACVGKVVRSLQPACTYRGMNDPALNQLVQMIRERSGCLFFERRTEAKALRDSLEKGGLLLGIFSDQHPVRGGVMVPFMGRPCATTTANAVLALRYHAVLFTAICYRTALGRWRVEIGDEIPTRTNGEPRDIAAITADINAAFELAVRRDPANWFWVHNRWKRSRDKRFRNSPANAPADGPAEESVTP